MKYRVRLLHSLNVILRRLSEQGLNRIAPVADAARMTQALIKEVSEFPREAVQWNPAEYEKSKPLEWHEDGFKELHPAVRGTSYMEVNKLIETSGCSPEQPYWVWSALGLLETPRGSLIVCPNDWIIEIAEKLFIVVPDTVYREHYKETA